MRLTQMKVTSQDMPSAISSIERLRLDKSDNRRKDAFTRKAIDEIQELLFDPDASVEIFKLILSYFKEITKSDKAVCFISKDNAELPIAEKSALSALYIDEVDSFVNESVLAGWVGQKSLLKSPIYYNSPMPKGVRALMKGNSDLASMMILPIELHGELRAVCILASQKEVYSASIVHKIKPIIGAVMCSLQSAESVRGNFKGLDKTITDNRYLSSLISSSPVGVIVVKADRNILLSNPVAQNMFFHKQSERPHDEQKTLAGVNILRFIPDYESLFQWSNQQAQYGDSNDENGPRVWEEQKALCFDGSKRIVNLTIFRYTHGTQRLTTLQIQDVTSVQKSKQEFKQTTQQLNAITQLAPVAIIRVSVDWQCMFANDKWLEFSGVTADETQGSDWINVIHSSDVNEFLENVRNSLSQGIDHKQEVRLVSPLGSTRWVDFSMRVLFSINGEVEGFLGTCADVTERYINQEKLRHIAEYDGLTGLANRVLFQDRLQQAFVGAERTKSIVSVFFLDLDGFKDVNDSLGHNIGDILLQKVAERLMNALRKNDTIARFGGDEFVVLLGKDTHPSDIAVVAEKVIQIVAEPYIIESNNIFITTSLGIAQGNHNTATPDILLKNADFALYNAKNEGKNKFQIFNEELEAGSIERINLINELRVGIKDERFALYYQAICDSVTQQVCGFESLLRFKSENGTIVSPDRFIPILEETRMIIQVGAWVIDETCRQLKACQQSGQFPEKGYLAFNVSAKQLLDDDFVLRIAQSCKRHQVNPQYLVMEMTESVIINKPEKVKSILNEVKLLGIRLALDDFGTGYSSLSYLQNYPFDIIKIDKTFVDNVSDNSNNRKIVKAIIALAASLELKVVAEGVETSEARRVVAELGAQLFQGYLVSKPVPAENIPALLAQ